MGINQIGFIAPRAEPQQAQKEKKSAVETILEGLSIANGVLGIAGGVQTIREKQGNIEGQQFAAKGGMTKEQETAALGKGMTFSESEVPGGTQAFIQTPKGEKAVFIAPPAAKPEKVGGSWQSVFEGGKEVKKWVADGSGITLPQKPDRGMDDKSLGQTADLRKEYNSQKTTQNTYQVIEGYNKVKQAGSAENPSPTDDMSLIFGFMKMQDPNSTVREGEYASAENTRGIPDGVLQAYNKAVDGQKLTPEQRSNFTRSAEGILDAQMKTQEPIDKRYADIANRFKVDPNYVTEPSFASTRQSRAEAAKAKGGGRSGAGTALGAPSDAVPGVPLSDIEKELQRRGLKPKGASGSF